MVYHLLCVMKKRKGHSGKGPGLSIQGILKEKDAKESLKDSSLNELIGLIQSGQLYVYVQTIDHPEGK